MCNCNERSQGLELQSTGLEEPSVHLGICAFVWPMRQQNHQNTTNTQKTPSDGNRSTMIFCKFVYLCASQQNHSLNKLPQRISLAKLFDVTLNSGYLLRDKSQHSLEVEAISYIQDGSHINVKHIRCFTTFICCGQCADVCVLVTLWLLSLAKLFEVTK